MNPLEPFEKIIVAAGSTIWPELIQNLRASCETDWLDAGNPRARCCEVAGAFREGSKRQLRSGG